ncbi:MAG: cytochrome c [Terriglobia bacterium]|jgi:cytochrome c oxidase cbb3-type subunit III
MFNLRSTYVQRNASLTDCPARRVVLGSGRRVALGVECRAALVPAGIMLAAVLILAASPSFVTFAQSPSREMVTRGQSQFKQSCGFCHAPDATGARGPDLVRSKIVAHDVNGNLIGEVIRNGRPDKGMPPLPLNMEQITAIAAFLHNRAHEALESSQVPEKYPLAKLLTGNAEAGKAYFQGAGGCKACHSPTGDLKGIAGKYSPLRLQTEMIYPGGASSKSTVTVVLPTGERLQGPLVHLDEFTVALRDGSGWYRSFPLDKASIEVHDPLAAHRKLMDELTPEQFHNLFAYLETLR